MFCAKLKELKISGECPFSGSAKNNELGDFEERSPAAADVLPISKDVHGEIGEDLPQQKTSRAKVNLHTLGESIRKLACPEVSLIQRYSNPAITMCFTYNNEMLDRGRVFVARPPQRTSIITEISILLLLTNSIVFCQTMSFNSLNTLSYSSKGCTLPSTE